MKNVKKESIILLVLIAPLVYLLAMGDVPEKVPVHWNIKGEADRHMSPFFAWLVNAGVYLLLLLIPKIDPRKKNFEVFSSTYYKLRLAIIIFLTAIMMLSLAGDAVNTSRIITMAVLLLFIVIGNYAANIRPNYFVGIRTPWTLENETVWKKTHLLAGRLWFWGALAALIASFFIPDNLLPKLLVTVIVVTSLIPVVYSFFLFRKLSKI